MVSALIIYVLSVILNWKWVNIAYSKDGVRYGMYYNREDLADEPALALVPVINTIAAVRWIVEWPWKTKNVIISSKKFFKLKDL